MKILVSFANGIGGGAIGAFVLKTCVNSLYTFNGVGWLDRMLGNPPWWVWAAVGALVGGSANVIRQRKRQDQTQLLRDWAAQNRYKYRGRIERDDLEDVGKMDAFNFWHDGHNYLSGSSGDYAVEMVDFTSKHKANLSPATFYRGLILPRFCCPKHRDGSRWLTINSERRCNYGPS